MAAAFVTGLDGEGGENGRSARRPQCMALAAMRLNLFVDSEPVV